MPRSRSQEHHEDTKNTKKGDRKMKASNALSLTPLQMAFLRASFVIFVPSWFIF